MSVRKNDTKEVIMQKVHSLLWEHKLHLIHKGDADYEKG